MEINVYNQEGKKIGVEQLPDSIFNLPQNDALLHQVFTVKQKAQYPPYAHTKTRAEVRGGGAKPWRQKGTGRARHGSRRSPIWVGGGVTFGPRNIHAHYSVNRKMSKKAIAVILSSKVRSGLFFVMDSLVFSEPKTKQAARLLVALKQEGVSNLVLGSVNDTNFIRVFRNIDRVNAIHVQRLNILDLLNKKNCIISLNALKFLINSYLGNVAPVANISHGKESSTASRSKAGKIKSKLPRKEKVNAKKVRLLTNSLISNI